MSKTDCNCPRREGVHEYWCRSNNEHQLYRCKLCGKPTPQFAMQFAQCRECNERLFKPGERA